MEQYIIPAAAAVLVAIIEAIALWERRKVKKDREAAAAEAAAAKAEAERKEKAREELLLLVIQSNGAAIALGEATGRALQRGHTNGDMEAALEYAQKVKHKQKDFLAEQGIHAMWE